MSKPLLAYELDAPTSKACLTQVDVIKESQIKRGANCEYLVFGKHHMATIVALLDSFKDVCRVIRAIAVGLNDTCFCAIR
jgi:hypothetical protein